MELSKRMQSVAGQVSRGAVAADVGCDHGYVSIWLVQNGICPKVYAMDVRSGPLERAAAHIAENGLGDYIETILSDGLKGLPVSEDGIPAADTAIAAGMGGPLMVQILKDSIGKVQRMRELILQPQSEIAEVRKYLSEIGFEIVAENIVLEEGKYYPLMKAVNTRFPELMTAAEKSRREAELFLEEYSGKNGIEEAEWKELFFLFGQRLILSAHPVLRQFLEHRIEKNHILLQQLSAQAKQAERAGERYRALLQETEQMEKLRDGIY